MSARHITFSLFAASLATVFAQDPAPPITFHHTPEALVVELLDDGLSNSWGVEASTDLGRWWDLGEIMEIRGTRQFRDRLAPLYEQRCYRAVHRGDDLQATLDRNRARWTNHRYEHYDFTFQWICFCLPDFVTPVDISVRHGEISSIIREGRELPPSQFAQYSTIDGLFDILQGALDQDAHRLTARFAPEHAAPVEAQIDYEEFLADEERAFVVRDLRIFPALPVQITDTPRAEIQLDPFSLLKASTQGNTITLEVQYGGGCTEHEFELFMSPAAFLESVPVQADLYLRHNAHGDLCRALIKKEITFDLSPIRDLHQHPNDPIILNVYHYGREEPGERISLRWEPPAVQLTDTSLAELQLDPFWLRRATIVGHTLTLSVEASGGCRPHTYDLFMSPATVDESSPPHVDLYLRHDGHDDPCDAIVQSEISFDLRPISQHHGQAGPVILNIHEYFTDTPGDPLRLPYE